ncbi:MAG: hypothetical protein IJ069_04360 [Prevotella sp.]|jgi:hypothetical protein|nr:hypothetical protein [Prevotella sp.]
MSKFICSICGYVHDDITAPENCPVCMASASEFSEIEEVPQIENEPTEDKAEVIVETKGDITDESIIESDKDRLKPNEFVKPTIDNTNNQGNNSNSTVSVDDKMESDEEEIVNLYKKTGAALQVVKWYKETYNVGLKEAKDRVDFVLDKHGLRSLTKGSGCMITILIAITSTLSAFFLL